MITELNVIYSNIYLEKQHLSLESFSFYKYNLLLQFVHQHTTSLNNQNRLTQYWKNVISVIF